MTLRRTFQFSLVIGALIAGAMGLRPASGEPPPPLQGQTTEAGSAPSEPNERPDHDQLLDHVEDYTPIVDALPKIFDGRFAGAWFEVRGDRDVFVAGVVAPTGQDLEALTALWGKQFADRLEVREAKYTADELQAQRTATGEVLARKAQAGSIGDYSVSIDHSVNRVVVTAEGSGAELRALSSASGDAVDVRSEQMEIEEVDARDVFPPYKAGLRNYLYLNSSSGWNPCTSAYIYENGYGRFASTAGHCGNSSSSVKIGSTVLGVTGIHHYNFGGYNYTDSLLYSLDAHPWPVYNAIETGGYDRVVKDFYSNPELNTMQNVTLCY